MLGEQCEGAVPQKMRGDCRDYTLFMKAAFKSLGNIAHPSL